MIDRLHVLQALNAILMATSPGAAHRCDHFDDHLPAMRETIKELLWALVDLDEHIVSPLLKPPQIKNRPPRSWQTLQQQILVAGCMALEETDTAPLEARKEICKLANKLKMKVPGGRPITVETLYKWWKKFRTSDPCRRLVRESAGLSKKAALDRTARILSEFTVLLGSSPHSLGT
jgi:hypothetical protein